MISQKTPSCHLLAGIETETNDSGRLALLVDCLKAAESHNSCHKCTAEIYNVIGTFARHKRSSDVPGCHTAYPQWRNAKPKPSKISGSERHRQVKRKKRHYTRMPVSEPKDFHASSLLQNPVVRGNRRGASTQSKLFKSVSQRNHRCSVM
jgi:hypothetical protein